MSDEPKEVDTSDEVTEVTDNTMNEETVNPDGAAAQADVMLEGEKQKHENETTSMRNKLIAVTVVVLLLLAGAFVLFGSSDTDDESANQSDEIEQTTDTEETVVATPDEFDQVVYAHSSAQNLPRMLFNRPVVGGEREDQDFSFGRSDFLRFDVDGNSYLVANGEGDVFYGMGTEEPTKIFTAAENIEGLALDVSSSTALVLERSFSETNAQFITTITQVSTTGGDSTVFFQEDAVPAGTFGVVFIEHWDGDAQSLIARRSCTQCDGYDPNLIRIDAEGNETPVFTAPETIAFGYTFNEDGSKALAVDTTAYDSAEISQRGLFQGLGGPNYAPFTLIEIDMSDGSTSEIVTFGDVEDANDEGIFASTVTAYTDTGAIAYAYEQQLFVQNGQGNFDNFFETGQGNIQSIYRVDEDELLVGAANDEGQTLSYFNIDTQEGAIVMETTFETTILGVSLR